MSDHRVENSSSNSATYEEVARQIMTVTDPLTQQLARLYELMQEVKAER